MGEIVATITNSMAEITYDLDDREIYNDIRAETEITETTTDLVTDEEAEYGTGHSSAIRDVTLYPGQSYSGIVHAPSSAPQFSWVRAMAQGSLDLANGSGIVYDNLPCVISSVNGYSCTITFTNNTPAVLHRCSASAIYQYLVNGPVMHEETETKQLTYTIYATDETSKEAYGRCSRSLDWPLGQTKSQMQSIANAYLARYKDPYPRVTMRLLGSDDTKIALILALDISNRITVINSEIGMSANFFINSINLTHDLRDTGLLEATFDLEIERGSETYAPWILDTSELDTETILG